MIKLEPIIKLSIQFFIVKNQKFKTGNFMALWKANKTYECKAGALQNY